MARAAQYVADMAAPDFIDINMGCPTPKIVNNGDGCALMRDAQRAAAVVAATVAAVDVPVTVKIRKGWDQAHVNAVEIALLAQQAGAAAVAVHGRTRDQFYSGVADWQIIKEVCSAVTIPVIGNGDVRTAEDAARLLEQTGCAAVMVGRAALGNPWIFRTMNAYLESGQLLAGPTPAQ